MTYFIYIFLLLLLCFLTYRRPASNSNHNFLNFEESINIKLLLSLLIISFFVGFRYEVGNDWLAYKNYFFDLYNVPFQFNSFVFESGYFLINKSFNFLGFSYQVCFMFISFFTWYLIYRSVPKEILCFFIFYIFCNEMFFWSMNGVRQFIAVAFLLNAVKYIVRRQILFFFLCIFLGSLFHQTISLFYLLYFIPTKYFYNRLIMISFFILSLLVGNTEFLVSYVKDSVELLSIYFNFGTSYIEGYIFRDDRFYSREISVGLGYYFIIFSNFFIILFSKNIIQEFPKLKIYFFLFFVGAILYNSFYTIHLIQRINQYFLIFKPLILSYYTYYYYSYRRNDLICISLFILYFLFFIVMIANSSNMCNPYRISF